jgi:hypothetical protein
MKKLAMRGFCRKSIIDGLRTESCKTRMKTGVLREFGVPAGNRTRKSIPSIGGGFERNPRDRYTSCAIFTKYMIHRFIKHGKRFVTFFSEKYSFLCRKMDLQETMQFILQFRVE